MKEGKVKKRIRFIIGICIIISLMPAGASAETVTVPMNMEIEPIALDFEITEAIGMSAVSTEKSNILQIDDLTVTSSASNLVDMVISDITVQPYGDWQLLADSNDFSQAMDLKAFSIVTGEHDFSAGSCTSKATLSPGESFVMEFSGHVGAFKEQISEQAASMIVTVEFAPEKFTFRIDLVRAGGQLTEFTAVEGMTWGEWIESEYNTVGFVPCVNGGCHILHPDNYVIFDPKGDIRISVDSEIVEYKYLMTDNYEKPL